MALMVPDSLPSGANQGEKRLYELLQFKLPNDFYVWYEPIVQGRLPYFTILAPRFGLLIIEVANWFPHEIASADSGNFTIKSQREKIERTEAQQSPVEKQDRRTRKRSSILRQGRDYLDKLLDKLKAYPILTQPDGDYQGKIAFSVSFGAVMSNMTAAQAREKNIYDFLSENQVVYREELLSWNNICEADLVNRLKIMFTDRFDLLPLKPNQIETIKGILYPEIAIKEVPASPGSVPDGVKLQDKSYVIQTLDHRQECITKAIGEGHRIIYGVAGSGKTLILLCRAKLLANQNPNQRILILCYNIGLACYLKSLLHESTQNSQFKTIEVMHFDGWVNSLLGKDYKNLKPLVDSSYSENVVHLALEKISRLSTERKWDAILVDEAQAFYPNWFKCCVAALKNSDNGNLMIVSDGNQSIYKRPGFTWKSVGVKAVGRTTNKKFNLDVNYRNTQEILVAAWSVVKDIQNTENTRDSEDVEVTFPIIEPRAAIHRGSRPVLHIEMTEHQEVESVVRQIQELHQSGYELRDIAVLYRFASGLDKESQLIKYLTNQLKEVRLASYWITQSLYCEKSYSVNIPGIRIISTINSLGLEFKVILILWVQHFSFTIAKSERDSLNRKELYVAMTRAQDILHIFGSGNSPLLEELKRSGTFEIQHG